MDVIVELADTYVFDKMYAKYFPVARAGASAAVQHGLKPMHHLANASLAAAANAEYGVSHTYRPASSAAAVAAGKLATTVARDNIYRQSASILLVAGIGAAILYFVFSAMSYYLMFDRRLEHHPRFLKNQVRMEIESSLWAIPTIDIMTLPWFLAEVRGKSLLYSDVKEYGWAWLVASTVIYLAFNDIAIYWIHRIEHHPRIYKYVHKPHHKWIIPTPWAALAFHPVDGYAQSLPYHIFVFIFPMHKYLYLILFVGVQLWTIFIHDGDMLTGGIWDKFLNSPAHHTMHHMYFTCNYGQYFTWADNYFQSHRAPEPENDPLIDSLRVMRAKGLVDANNNPIPQSRKLE